MIIGFEAQRIFRTHKHGMDFVALELIRALQKIDTSNQYVIFTNEGPDTTCLTESENLKIVTFSGAFAIWEQVLLPRRAKEYKCDILHCTSNTAPVFSKVPTVVTLHDIIYLENNPLFAKGYNPYQRFGNYYRRLVVQANLRKVMKIVTVSNFEKKRLMDFLGLSSERVEVVYNGVGPHFFNNYSDEEVKQVVDRYNLPKNYFLFLGNTDPKKNTKNVILAFAKFLSVEKSNLKLVVADLNGDLVGEILKAEGLHEYFNRIHFTGYIDNKDLPIIMKQAEVFLYPSKRESFGIPILESMAVGTAVMTSDAASMPEVAGGSSHLVDPNDMNSMVLGMQALHQNEILRQELEEKGKVRISSFKWQDSAQQMLRIYKSVINESRNSAGSLVVDSVGVLHLHWVRCVTIFHCKN